MSSFVNRTKHHEKNCLLVSPPKWDGERFLFEIATPDGKFEIYFKCKNVRLTPSIESSLLLAALPAMQLNIALIPTTSASQTFCKNLYSFSKIYSGWFSRYQPLQIKLTNSKPVEPAKSGRIGVFFSGGVDSFYTFLKHQHVITDLIYIHGYDLKLEDHFRRSAISDMGKSIAEQTGTRFIEIETNCRDFLTKYGKWGEHVYGVALGIAGRVLAGDIDKIYMASSFSLNESRPWGSHPETIPLLSDEKQQILYDGTESNRMQKIQKIKDSQLVLDHLRVCWENRAGNYNCGTCEKCLRTMTTLYAFDALKHSKTFPHTINEIHIKNLYINHGRVLRMFIHDNLKLLERMGKRTSSVYKAWQQVLDRSSLHNHIVLAYRKKQKKISRIIKKLKT